MPDTLEPQPSPVSVTRTPVATRARIYYADFQTIWSWMQRVYAKDAGDAAARTDARRALFRNNQLSVLAQIHAKPESRMPMFLSLVAQAEATRRFDGWESIFLTLLHAANESDQREVFDRALTAWNRFGAQPTVAGAGQVLFYDTSARKLVFLSRDTSASLRAGGNNAHRLVFGPTLGSTLTELGSAVIQNPFQRGPSRVLLGAEGDGPRGSGGVIVRGFEAAASTAVAVGVAMETFPLPEPTHKVVGAYVLLVGVTFEAGLQIGQLWGEWENCHPSSDDVNIGETEVDPGVMFGKESTGGSGGSGQGGIEIGVGEGGDGGEGGGDDGGDGPSGCFVGDSTILMADGLAKAIADVQEGDAVMAWNEVDRLRRLRRVTRVHRFK